MATGLVSQCLLVTRISANGLRRRWWSSLNTVIGTASVVGVLVAMLSIAAGYGHALKMAGSQDNILVLHNGAQSELASSLSGEHARLIAQSRGVARDADGRPLAAAEGYAIASLQNPASRDTVNVAVRGVEPVSYALRPQLKLVAGRKPAAGMREVIIGRRAQQQFAWLRLGAEIPIADGRWKIVGIFDADGGIVESEIWADATALQSAYGRGDSVQVVVLRRAPGVTAEGLGATLARDSRLDVKVVGEAAYYGEQSAQLGSFVRTLGFSISFLMGLGAVFAALNAGLSAMSTRTKEIATLSAIGIDARAIMSSVLAESVALALLGGALGATIAYVLFDGRVVSTLFFSPDFSQVVFAFSVTGAVLAQAVAGTMLIGVLGGLYPAWRALRLPVARALADRR
jgi:putative ABC transport system permease protein